MNISDIQDFRTACADVRDGTFRLDTESDRVKVSSDNLFGRLVSWIKSKIAPNSLERTSQEAAHGRFLQAIANHSGYSPAEVSRAEALLSTDAIYRKPLTTRRVREVLGELDGASSAVARQNRIWADGVVAGMERRVAERDSGVELDDRSSARLAKALRNAIASAGQNGARALSASEANQIADNVVDAFLEGRLEGRTEPAAGPPAPARAQPTPSAAVADLPTPPSGAATPSSSAPASVSPADEPTYVDVTREGGRKALLGELKSAQLPKEVAVVIESLIQVDTVKDLPTLADRANRKSADYAVRKCVDGWYADALKAQADNAKKAGIDVKEVLPKTAPDELKTKVSKALIGFSELLPWSEVEHQAQGLVQSHIGQAVWQQSRMASGDELDLDGADAVAPRRASTPPATAREAPTPASVDRLMPADRKSPAEIRRALDGIELPGGIKSSLQTEIDSGAIRGISELARRSNDKTTDWLMQNRMQQWYNEALAAHGAQVGGRLTRTPPGDLLLAVSGHMAQTRQLLDYPAVKVQVRRLIGAQVAGALAERSRVGAQGAAPQQSARIIDKKALLKDLGSAGLPREVRSDIEKRVRSGEIHDFAGLARWGNQRTADWALANRFDQWWGEGLKEAGKRLEPPRVARLPKTPTNTAKSQFSDAIAEAPELMAYADVKSQGRALVARRLGLTAAGV